MKINLNIETDKIYEKINNLLGQQIISFPDSFKKEYLDYFDQKCKKSKTIIQQAKKIIPGGVQHNLSFNYPFPIVISKAEGAYLEDIDGNKYIDFLQAGGPTILGSNYEPVRKQVIDVLENVGPVTGLFHEYELKIAKKINEHYPAVEMFRMLGSGTESVMAAIRVARLFTKKKKIIKIGGAYHGWSDQMVYGLHIPGTRGFEAHGIPHSCRKHTQEVYPNDIKALEQKLRWNQLRGGTAAVFLEPVGPESGTRPIFKNYNQQVKELCDQYGALLVFDEVVTAFRVGLKGAQGFYNIKPDLTIFGKIITGGYPSAGGLGGKAEIISHLAAGLESGKKRAYCGGTLAANPLSSAAGYFTIKEIERTNACEKAARAGTHLISGLHDILSKYDLPFVAYNQASICHLETVGAMFIKLNLLKIKSILKEIKARKHAMEEYGAAYMAAGLVTLAGSRMYTSMADTPQVIDEALSKFEIIFSKIKQ